LAGGDSTRMGRDKALLSLDRAAPGRTPGRTLVERAAETLAEVCGTVAVADRGRRYLAEYPSLADGAGRGPAAGLLGAAQAFPGRALLVLACDLPAVPAGLLRALAEAGGDLALPRHGESAEESAGETAAETEVEPLVACYRPRALAALAARVAAGRFALHPLAADPELDVRFLEGGPLAAFGAPAELFANLNRPADLPAD
jgi:molybdopterin-guanine dinucleotide biosynthesis protein A